MRIKRRNGLVSALLGLVTCGLYHIFFWYQYGEDTNWVCRDDRKMTQNYIVAGSFPGSPVASTDCTGRISWHPGWIRQVTATTCISNHR